MGRAQFASVCSFLGAGLLVFGCILLWNPVPVQSQNNGAEYEGIRECRGCHRTMTTDFAEGSHSRTMVAADDEDIAPLADFSAGEDVRTVQFPDEDEPRPFNVNDIAYSLGSGIHVQRYLYEIEEDVFMVFPAEWNTVTGEWQAYETGDEWLSDAYNFNLNCSYCHVTGFESDTLEWDDEGVQCEACHGPGSEHVILMDELGFILNERDREDLHESINSAVDPQTCGQCHSRGISDSAHPYPTNYAVGEDLSSTWELVSQDAADNWHPTGQAALPNMQYNEWLLSGHAESYTSATESDAYELECLSCHSSGVRRALRILDTSDEDPEALPIPEVEAERLPFGVTCSTCHNPHDDSDEDEDFDRVAATYAQCTSCHQSADDIAGLHHPVQEVYEGLELVEEVEPVVGVHFSAENGPTCTTCHMPSVPVGDGARNSHFMTPISPAAALDVEAVQDSCTACHELVEGQSMQELIDAVQSSTQARYEAASAALADDSPQWVADSLMVVANEGSWGVHNVNYTSALLNAAEAELGLRETGAAELVLPPIERQAPLQIVEEEAELDTVAFGLTMPALILLGVMLGIILISGVAFFRGGDA